jgi:hypothetical protein
MHSDWFNGIEILQGRWEYGEKVGYCYPSGLEDTRCKRDIYVPLVTKGLIIIKRACQTGGPWAASGPFQNFGCPRTFKIYLKYRQTLHFVIN